ncbi:MAG: hypothetical protein GF372_14565 [Candidatus Marinimicrobia bacterium]|nr:hypothetical protein [Candidatus Neomarinimicrobiota bacterium]
MSCPCDTKEYFHGRTIPAGLDSIPRQIGTFPEFRSYMLSLVGTKNALSEWRARSENDLGIMLLEMWAYICDVVTFYDETFAHEAYLRTARRRPSLRQLTDLIGYLPKPAAAASATLAIKAQGRELITVPAEAAFRSKAFDEESPQIFETTDEQAVHPLFSEWTIERQHYKKVGEALASENALLITPGTLNAEEDNYLFITNVQNFSKSGVRSVSSIEDDYQGRDGETYIKLIFDGDPTFKDSSIIADIRVFKSTQSAPLWTGDHDDAISSDHETLLLDGLYKQIRTGQYILVERAGDFRWFSVASAKQVSVTVQPAQSINVSDGSNTSTIDVPAVTTAVTQITLDVSLNASGRKGNETGGWVNSHRDDMAVHFGMVSVGDVTQELKTTLSPADDLSVSERLEEPADVAAPTQFFLKDLNNAAVTIPGQLEFETDKILLDQNHGWEESLRAPVIAQGNLIEVTRGQSVKDEVLGSGDASIANQTFELKKNPLTYLPSSSAGNEWNLKSTLEIYVNGILWSEARSFFGTDPEDQVYVIRHDEKGNTRVLFGDGENGARLPSGEDNIVAHYRHGAGEAAPPDNSITQMIKPITGITSISNFLPAYGGSDAESAETIRENAPASALLFSPKRAVSIADFQTVAAEVTGVQTATARWVWDDDRQRPVVKLWYMGDAQLLDNVTDALLNAADPTTPIQVLVSNASEVSLTIEVIVDAKYIQADVEADILEILLGPDGRLLPENLGIGTPVFRSEIAAMVHFAEGVLGMQSIFWNQDQLSEFGKDPGDGYYFDFTDAITVSTLLEDTHA